MVSLERQGLGASAGLTFLCVPGDGSERWLSLLGVDGDSPGLWGWASFGFGAKGGFCMPELIIASLTSVQFCGFSEAETNHPGCPGTFQDSIQSKEVVFQEIYKCCQRFFAQHM